MTAFAAAMKTRNMLEQNHDAAAAYLKEMSGTERGPMGLTPDHVKARPEWRVAFNAERAAFKAMADFNRYLARNFKTEMRAEREAKRAAR